MNVADNLIRFANVDLDNVDEIAVELPPLGPLHDGDVDSLLVNLLGVRAVAATADVDDVRRRREEPDQRLRGRAVGLRNVSEHRRTHSDVVEVAGALPRVVRDVNVARVDPIGTDVVNEMRHGISHCVHVARRAGDGLGDHPPAPVEHASRQVTGLTHRSTKCGTDQRQRLLFDDRDQPIPHHLVVQGVGGVHGGVHCALRLRVINNVLSACTVHVWCEASTVVVCASAMIAGPCKRVPGDNSLRSITAVSTRSPDAAS